MTRFRKGGNSDKIDLIDESQNPFESGSHGFLQYAKSCREMNKKTLLASDKPYTKEHLEILTSNIAE